MKKEQYLRSNRVVFITMMIIMVYLTVTFIMAVLTGTKTVQVYIQIAASILSIIADIVVYTRMKDTRTGALIM